MDDRFLVADLPGYGYANAPEEVRERWGPLIESYLSCTPALLGIVMLIDARRGVGSDDERLLAYLAELGIPTLFVLTKADKLNRSGRKQAADKARRQLGVDEDQILVTSGKTGLGVRTLWESVLALVEEGPAER